MRIACVDESAASRVALQKYFDDVYDQCRNEIGHLKLVHYYPCSKSQAMINGAPSLFAIGPGYSTEYAYLTCKELRRAHPETPILVLVDAQDFSLRTLKRFEKVCDEVLSCNEAPIRIVHKISSYEGREEHNAHGALIAVSGAKGGVGTTSMVSALAHAAQSMGRSSIVIDLSAQHVFSQYMRTSRWQSPDFTAALVDDLPLDKDVIERCISHAPNGVHLLLPPSGSAEVRELWLRNPETFELSLSVIETLKELYEVVIVDCAGVEGVLPFAITCRADTRLLVTSNEPASVHLLNTQFSMLSEMPGHGKVQIVLNDIRDSGLDRDDIVDLLFHNEFFDEESTTLSHIPYCKQGTHWIGSGNTFYTETTTAHQTLLEQVLCLAIDQEYETETNQQNFLALAWNTLGSLTKKRKELQTRRLLPWFDSAEDTNEQEPAISLMK